MTNSNKNKSVVRISSNNGWGEIEGDGVKMEFNVSTFDICVYGTYDGGYSAGKFDTNFRVILVEMTQEERQKLIEAIKEI